MFSKLRNTPQPNLDINIGIDPESRQEIAAGLSRVLADTYTLYLKTHNFYWNVTGPMLPPLLQMFEMQYSELATAVDEIAGRIRALGFPVPGTYREFARLSMIPATEGVPSAEHMMRELLEGNEAVVRTARSAVAMVERGYDESTLDLLTKRMQVHEKNAWMLRSMLAE